MTSGYVLIVAILVLGGVIATVGDRLGTRIGKARLSLFNLRPRKTAVLVTILTGGIISASTLAILFAVSDQLRTGVFELGRIQGNLAKARDELQQARSQKQQVEKELTQTRSDRAAAQKLLGEINTEKIRTQAQLDRTQTQLNNTQSQLSQAQVEKSRTDAQLNQTQRQLGTVSQQARGLRSEIERLQTERQELIEQQNEVRAQIAQRDEEIAERNQTIAQRDEEIAAKEQVIAQRETRLKALENEQVRLERIVKALAQYSQAYQEQYESLRQGNVALVRGQLLASGVVRIVANATPTEAARQAIDQLLREANRNSIRAIRPGAATPNERVIQITRTEVEQLIDQIEDGRDYVVQILSAGNYVLGEDNIQVVARATPNQVVFLAGDVVAAASIDPATMNEGALRQRIELLLAAAEFRARGAGALTEGVQIEDGPSVSAMLRFAERLKQFSQPVEVKAVTTDVIYTAGPLTLELVALQDGQVLFRTGEGGLDLPGSAAESPSPSLDLGDSLPESDDSSSRSGGRLLQ